MKLSKLKKIIKEEILKAIKESSKPSQEQLKKMVASIPANTIVKIHGKSIFNLGNGKYIYPFPTENVLSDQELAQELENNISSTMQTSFEEQKNKK